MITHITTENYKKVVVESKLPVLIDFWAPWCGPCQMMGPVFEEVAKEFNGKIVFAKLNTEDYPELTNGFGIQGIPCLILTKSGKEVGRAVGFLPKDLLKQKVQKLYETI